MKLTDKQLKKMIDNLVQHYRNAVSSALLGLDNIDDYDYDKNNTFNTPRGVLGNAIVNGLQKQLLSDFYAFFDTNSDDDGVVKPIYDLTDKQIDMVFKARDKVNYGFHYDNIVLHNKK